eukprot:CAMPEP_0116562868 /NCGR_PEP_ID=MMETSP0397-20121206/12408_1 /TAXON_ID=216820 /ORGANISM="Cyclophora tenuis, Strain ECT3854" /LENGTH=120 /DNA_ID=CAMNT_0004089231 /DNA_START=194 /DNA_END=553 /DNA_ORIENTATION=+
MTTSAATMVSVGMESTARTVKVSNVEPNDVKKKSRHESIRPETKPRVAERRGLSSRERVDKVVKLALDLFPGQEDRGFFMDNVHVLANNQSRPIAFDRRIDVIRSMVSDNNNNNNNNNNN